MGRRNQIKPFLLFDSVTGDLSQATLTSKESTVAQTDVVEILIKWAGGQATNGDVLIEVWNSETTGWNALDFGATISLDTSSGNHQLIIQQVSFEKVRISYTRTNAGATGTIIAEIFATTVGA